MSEPIRAVGPKPPMQERLLKTQTGWICPGVMAYREAPRGPLCPVCQKQWWKEQDEPTRLTEREDAHPSV
jgi:hypothetical protein